MLLTFDTHRFLISQSDQLVGVALQPTQYRSVIVSRDILRHTAAATSGVDITRGLFRTKFGLILSEKSRGTLHSYERNCNCLYCFVHFTLTRICSIYIAGYMIVPLPSQRYAFSSFVFLLANLCAWCCDFTSTFQCVCSKWPLFTKPRFAWRTHSTQLVFH